MPIVRRAGSLRLYVLAGLPTQSVPAVVRRLEKVFVSNDIKFLAQAACDDDDRPYERGTVEALLRSVAGFALRRRVNSERQDTQVTPGRVVLLYVRSQDEEKLLEAFDHFCLPVPLEKPDQGHTRPGEWRWHPDMAAKVVSDVVRSLENECRPVPNLPRNALITLPPHNFRLDRDGRTLADLLISVRQGKVAAKELDQCVRPRKFTREDLPEVLRGAQKGRYFADNRGIVFPPATAGSGDHGLPRLLPMDADIKSIQILMNQLYRRGTPLEWGFHHDAQYPGGRKLVNEKFMCRKAGDKVVSGTHANVYPNDVVRESAGRPPKE